jgi:serine O-acetyltransferase
MWGIAVHAQAIIGCNVNLSKGNTIGAANRGEKAGVPTIGNRVWVGTNAILVGKINIGDNSLIAPGAYVNFDVPNNSIVMGNPGKIINTSTGAVDGYINNIVKETNN